MHSRVPHRTPVGRRLAVLRKRPRSMMKRLASDAVVTGSAASVASAAALMVCSAAHEGSAAGGLNGPSQWLWGEAEAYTREATLRHTATGYAIHHATSMFWGVMHEAIFGGRRHKPAIQHCAEAAVSATTAYFVDYYLTPPRLRPGFEKHVSAKGMVAVYAAFAAGIAITAIARDSRRRR
ncbi:hypothetical protein [Steroidobacter gossypii]|nr:hypothetical protein [Steroidobacter gossypii]